jgi:molybdopterin-guanine dinucleotide biosynthesis protein A
MSESLAGFILAGGKSSRMGVDKAFLELGGETLLKRALQIVREVTSEVRIVGSWSKFGEFGQVVEDIYPERGPLGGIHAALRSSHAELNLMLGVDLPFMQAEFLAWLCERASRNDAVVTVPKARGRLQPLCAVYRKGFAEIAEEALQTDRNKIDLLFDEVKTEVVEVPADFLLEMFNNLNTREEWESARKRLSHT